MKKTFAMLFVALLLAGIVYLLPVAPHTAQAATLGSHSLAKPSIVTGPCTDPTFLTITANGKNVCFANNGYIGYRLTNVTAIYGGNNGGWVRCYGGICAAKGETFYFDPHTLYDFMGGALITQVDITHQG